MNKPHKHAALIHEWADGAEIEYWDDLANIWVSCPNNAPTWGGNNKYRVKPKVEQRRYRVALLQNDSNSWAGTAETIDEASRMYHAPTFVRWLSDWVEYEVEVRS